MKKLFTISLTFFENIEMLHLIATFYMNEKNKYLMPKIFTNSYLHRDTSQSRGNNNQTVRLWEYYEKACRGSVRVFLLTGTQHMHEGAVKIAILNLDLHSFGNMGSDAYIRGGNFLFLILRSFGPATNSVKILNPLIKTKIQFS